MMPIISLGSFAPIVLGLMGVLMVVLRAGASQVFFDVVGRFQAKRLIKDADTQMTVFNALILDSISNIQEAGQAFGDTIDAFVESILPSTIAIADATIELEKFVSAGEDFEGLKEDVMELGASFGYTGDQALQAASKMAQLASVLGEGQVAVGSQLGFEFGLISGMETEKAMQRLVNLNQQIHFMTAGTENLTDAEEKGLVIRQNTLRVLDQLNTIENRSAATMEQVTFVMNQFASQANLTGESLAFMAAQSALLIEAGEEQGKGGRAIRAVYARLGADTSGAATALQDLGIATHDANDSLLPLSEILRQLNEKWPTMEKGQQQNIAQVVAGNRHYTRLIKLIEGYDRVLQLQHEGEMALMPALDEVNIRLESNINRYREAEANLANYQARLGDALLPSLTAVTEKQAAFNKSLAEVVEFSPTLIGGFVGLAGVIRTTFGPLFNTFLMFQSLSVATTTLTSVTRALAGEEIVLATAYGQGNEEAKQYTERYRMLNILRNNEIHGIKQQKINFKELSNIEVNIQEERMRTAHNNIQTKKQDLKLHQASIFNKKEEIRLEKISQMQTQAAIDEEGKLGVVTNQQTANLINLRIQLEELMEKERKSIALIKQEAAAREEAAHALSVHGVARARAQEARDKEAGDTIARNSLMLNSIAGAATAAGGAMMLLSNNTKVMQAGMALSTVSMLAFTAANLRSEAATIKNAIVQNKYVRALGRGTVTGLNHILTFLEPYHRNVAKSTELVEENTEVQKINTKAIKEAVVAFKNYVTTLGGFLTTSLLVVAAVAAIGHNMAKTKYQASLLSAEFEGIESSAANVTEVMAGLDDATSSGLLKDIQDQRALITRLQDSELESADQLLAIELEKLGTLEEQFRIISGMEAARGESNAVLTDDLKLFMELNNQMKELEEKTRVGRDSVFSGGASRDGFSLQTLQAFAEGALAPVLSTKEAIGKGSVAEQLDLMNQNLEVMRTNAPQYAKVFTGIQEGLIVDDASLVEYLKQAGIEYEELFGKKEDGSGVNEAKSWELATDAIQKFSNAREELFYGMSANNLTGDLIKQVQQTGVENLISNTEVIMTNNFNGMTTRQVANEILAQINQGAGGLGININLNTV